MKELLETEFGEKEKSNIFLKILGTLIELFLISLIISIFMIAKDVYSLSYDFGSHFWDSFYEEHELSH